MRTKFNRAKSQPPPIIAAIRTFAAISNIDNKQLALEWDCNESTVSRFLSGKAWPDGATMGRVIGWLMGATFHADHCEVATPDENRHGVIPSDPLAPP